MRYCFRIAVLLLFSILLVGCDQPVSYSRDIAPILQGSCGDCHTGSGPGLLKSGLDLGSYEGLLKGTRFGPVVKPGDSFTSALVMLVEHRVDASIRMPHDRKSRLDQTQIELLKSWIDQGASDN